MHRPSSAGHHLQQAPSHMLTLAGSAKGFRQVTKELPSCPRMAVSTVGSITSGRRPVPLQAYSHVPNAALCRVTVPCSTVPAGNAWGHSEVKVMPGPLSTRQISSHSLHSQCLGCCRPHCRRSGPGQGWPSVFMKNRAKPRGLADPMQATARSHQLGDLPLRELGRE